LLSDERLSRHVLDALRALLIGDRPMFDGLTWRCSRRECDEDLLCGCQAVSAPPERSARPPALDRGVVDQAGEAGPVRGPAPPAVVVELRAFAARRQRGDRWQNRPPDSPAARR